MPYWETSDANFFSLVHHVLKADRPGDAARVRDQQRRPFTCLQFVAPYRDGRLPKATDFEWTLCYDLSPDGFSYVTEVPTKEDYLIVALGPAPHIFVSAMIVRQTAKEVDGRAMNLVGCNFLARLQNPPYSTPLGPRPA